MKRLFANALGISSLSFAQTSTSVILTSSSSISQTNTRYASWNIDSSCNRGFHHTNFTNPNLLAAAKALQPSTLRFGGSGNDNLVYGLTAGSPECADIPASTDCSYLTPGCLNSTQWNNLYDFGKGAGVDFIFGLAFGQLAACPLGPAYVWNSTNAGQLLSYLVANGQDDIWGFELGNELNNCGPGSTCACAVPPQQADAANRLSAMLSSTLPNALIIGPDAGGLNVSGWLQTYLPLVQPRLLHAVTEHVYNGVQRSSYNSPQQLDSVLPEIGWYTALVRALYPSAQTWAGENGPIGGGNDGTCGTDAVCGTFATTLWYVDDLALRAKYGFSHHQRQIMFGGAYGLTNSVTGAMALGPTDPIILRPDFWVNFLWKRTIGTSVWNATSSNVNVRAYAFSGSPPSPYAASQCSNSPLQLVLVHLDNTTAALVELPAVGSAQSFAAWTLAPGPLGPFDTLSTINGIPSAVTVDVSKGDPASYLTTITQAPVLGTVQAGATLQPASTTFLCYY